MTKLLFYVGGNEDWLHPESVVAVISGWIEYNQIDVKKGFTVRENVELKQYVVEVHCLDSQDSMVRSINERSGGMKVKVIK